MKTHFKVLTLAAVAGLGAAGGFAAGAASGSSEDPRLQVTTDLTDSKHIAYSGGETPEVLAKQAQMGITKYEPESAVGGDGAPEKTLIDNDVLRVNLVAFKKGFKRPGGMKRKNDQLLVYIDQGAYSLLTNAGKPNAKPISHRPAPGSAIFHRRDSIISDTRIDDDYRVLFIEFKKK